MSYYYDEYDINGPCGGGGCPTTIEDGSFDRWDVSTDGGYSDSYLGDLRTPRGRLRSILEPRWRPRSPRAAPRGAKKPNIVPRWANLAPSWGPKAA